MIDQALKQPTRAESLLVEAALRWRRNRDECKRLARKLEPCEEEQRQWNERDYSEADPPVPCWKRMVLTSVDPFPQYERDEDLCPSCRRNEDLGTVEALRRARRQRGPYVATLSRMAARVLVERADQSHPGGRAAREA